VQPLSSRWWGGRPRLRRVSRLASAPSVRWRSCAGPWKAVCGFNEPGFNWIVDNISFNAPELFPVPHQMIVAFVLPKGFSGTSQQLVGLPRTIAFQSAQDRRYIDMGREKQVNVIRHDHPGVQIAIRLGVLNATPDQSGNGRLFQMNGSEARGAEQSVHCGKCLPGGQTFFSEFAARWQAAMKAKGHEERLSDSIDVRQAAL